MFACWVGYLTNMNYQWLIQYYSNFLFTWISSEQGHQYVDGFVIFWLHYLILGYSYYVSTQILQGCFTGIFFTVPGKLPWKIWVTRVSNKPKQTWTVGILVGMYSTQIKENRNTSLHMELIEVTQINYMQYIANLSHFKCTIKDNNPKSNMMQKSCHQQLWENL